MPGKRPFVSKSNEGTVLCLQSAEPQPPSTHTSRSSVPLMATLARELGKLRFMRFSVAFDSQLEDRSTNRRPLGGVSSAFNAVLRRAHMRSRRSSICSREVDGRWISKSELCGWIARSRIAESKSFRPRSRASSQFYGSVSHFDFGKGREPPIQLRVFAKLTRFYTF